MRNGIRSTLALAVLVMLLSLLGSFAAAAAEIPAQGLTEVPAVSETVLLEETVPETTMIPETPPPETVPAETEPQMYTVDTESEIYRICEEQASTMESDQILVYDSTNDEILYTRTNEGQKLYPASITKLFSAWVALQHLEPGEILTAGDALSLVQSGSSIAYLGRGHRLYVKTVVEAMMLPSGNDAAMVLAAAAGRRIRGDEGLAAEEAVQAFVGEMNRMAKELGFERSHFSNPDGYHTGSHYTCLNDMARIAKLALENETISHYIRMGEDDVTFVSGQFITWENTNLFLDPDGDFYRRDAIGMKTGYTRQAEYCLMAAFKCPDGRVLVVGSFGCADEYNRYREIGKLANACQTYLK